MSYENGSQGPYQRDFISDGERSPRDGYNSLQSGEYSEIDLELFNRLLKVGIIKASPNIRPAQDREAMILDNQNSLTYLNGQIFAQYLLVIKQAMTNRNQDFNIEDQLLSELKGQSTPQARLFNWNYLCNELEKIGIIIENDVKSLYVAGDSDEVGKLFARLDRYILRISADKKVLNFDDFRKDEPSSTVDVQQDLMNLTINAGRRGLQSTQKKPVKDGVDIMQMDLRREPSDTESTLEFILNTLCRAMSMKPKQAAALLTNNNQFLIHCAVKGVKGRFEPMINWYQELYQYSRHLSMMLEVEIENAQQSRDIKVHQAANQNFDKVLQTISCGCYSQNQEVAQLCLKTLACVALDTQQNYEVVKLLMNWFNSKENGIYTINYAMKRHNELAQDFVTCVGNFCPNAEDMAQVYLNDLQDLYPEIIDYFNALNQTLPFLTLKYKKEMTQGRLLETIVDRCTSFATQGGIENPQVKISALSLLCEIWLNYSDHYKESNKLASIQGSFQRCTRDNNKSLRLVAVSCTFKLMDKFSQDKYPAAPSLYKQLIFSLIEAPQEQTIREFYLTNFQYLYENTKQIPIGLLLDPYLKLNQVQDIFEFVTFDYDFFTFVAQHPKLNVQNSIQMLDLLARQYLSDVCRSSVVAVPFMMVCSRFIGTVQCQEFIMKYITISLNQLLQIDQPEKSQIQNPPRQSSSNRAVKKDFRITSSAKKQSAKYRNLPQLTEEQAVTNKLKKAYIIQMLLKLQNLRQEDVNNAMKDMLLSAQKQFRQQNETSHKGINAVLKQFGNPDSLYNNYLKNQEKVEAEERKQFEKLKRQEQKEKQAIGYESDDKSVLRGSRSVKKLQQSSAKKSLALVPITENQQNLRALQELEMIKKYKKEKEVDEKIKKETDLRKQTLKQKQLAEELAKRRVELGQLQNVGGIKQELKAIIYAPDEAPTAKKHSKKFKNPIDEQIKLVDLNEEEDRDRELIKAFMKKYNKIWKYLHSRYQNQIYSIKNNQKDFDQIKAKVQNISLPEVTRMLKDHDCYPKLISKDELAQLIKLTNMSTGGTQSHELTTLDFQQFVNFIPQLAFVCFSRPPVDKSSFPPIASLQALIETFEKATRDRGKSTAIYEDPDWSSFKDIELINALEEKLVQEPNYPVPEGYKKVVEKEPVFSYEVPQCAKAILSEAQVVATEILDELLSNKFDIHFLEPLITFQQKIKVKQSFKKEVKQRDPLAYMRKAEKKVEERKTNAYQGMSELEKKKLEFEVKPKLRLSLKLQVTKHDLKSRPHYQEVAEVFEEILQAHEKGLNTLPPRQSRAVGQVQNQAKLEREAYEKAQRDLYEKKDRERKERDQKLKNQLISNEEGESIPIYQKKRIQSELEHKELQDNEREKQKKQQEYYEKQKAKLQAAKEQQQTQLTQEQEEANRKLEEDIQKRRQSNKEFLQRQKTKIAEDFKETYKKRDDIILREEEIKKKERENEDRLKKEMASYIKDSQQDRDVEKQERSDITEFLAKDDVQEVFDRYSNAMSVLFNFFANQDTQKDKLAHDSQLLAETLTFKELVRFGYQQELTPEFVTPDDMVRIYKTTVRETDENKTDAQKANMLDINAFKRALIRISIVAQEKLGDSQEDMLQKKLELQTKRNEELVERNKKTISKLDLEKQKQIDKEAKLREEFEKQQTYKDDQLSKKASQANQRTSPRSTSIKAQRAEQQKNIKQIWQNLRKKKNSSKNGLSKEIIQVLQMPVIPREVILSLELKRRILPKKNQFLLINSSMNKIDFLKSKLKKKKLGRSLMSLLFHLKLLRPSLSIQNLIQMRKEPH